MGTTGQLGTVASALGAIQLGSALIGGGTGNSTSGFTGQLGTTRSRLGNLVLGRAPGAQALGLTAAFVVDLALVASLEPSRERQLRANFVIDLATIALLTQGQKLAATMTIDLPVSASLVQGQQLAADLVLDLGLMPGLTQAQPLSADFVLDTVFDEIYTGPGSGVVIGLVTQDQQVAQLREGDEFRVTLSWAGVRGRTGLARVLSRSKDDTGRPTFKLLFIPTTDPSVLESQVTRPRYVVDIRTNSVRRLVDAERNVNKLEAQ